jgi:hypothetical protein
MKKLISFLTRPKEVTSSPEKDDLGLGKMADERICFFLDTSPFPSITPELYTELYAFVFIAIHSFVDREVPALLSMAEKSLFDEYEKRMRTRWPNNCLEPHMDMLDQRLDEYTLAIRTEDNPSYVIKMKTARYLSHASMMDEYCKKDSPLALTNPLEDLEVMKKLLVFHENEVRQILEKIRQKKDAIQSSL